MQPSSAIVLLSNIRIDDPEKLALFSVTVCDAATVFEEAHFKIRGCLSEKSITVLREAGFKRLFLYQQIQEGDWVAATHEMLASVQARSVFLYWEDHKLVAPLEVFASVVREFEALELDYLCYSFFRAEQLSRKNILPLYSSETENIVRIELDSTSLKLLGKISPRHYTFSLISLASANYLRSVLREENKWVKLYSRPFVSFVSRLFPYPGYRQIFHHCNLLIKSLSARLCAYEPSSPFNLEKMWWETPPFKARLRVGICKSELFANFDDDNGADGESLIKRGLYPFLAEPTNFKDDVLPSVWKTVELVQGQRFDLTYHSAVGRIRNPPIILASVKAGRITFRSTSGETVMVAGNRRTVYSNKWSEILAHETAVIELRVFDEVF